MSSAIISLLVSHILTFLENELIKEEPALVNALIHDVQSLISRLESLIDGKSPKAAAIANPVLNAVSKAAVVAVQAAGSAVAQEVQNS